MELNGYEIDIILDLMGEKANSLRQYSPDFLGYNRTSKVEINIAPKLLGEVKTEIRSRYPWVVNGKDSYTYPEQDVLNLWSKITH